MVRTYTCTNGTYTAMRLPRTPPPHQPRRCEGFDANFVAIIRNAQAPRTPTRSHARASRPCLGPCPRPSLLCTYSPGGGDDIRHGVRRLAAMGWSSAVGQARSACVCVRGVCYFDVASLRGALGHICVGFTACTSSFANVACVSAGGGMVMVWWWRCWCWCACVMVCCCVMVLVLVCLCGVLCVGVCWRSSVHVLMSCSFVSLN
jgi:hypothetical protein